VFFGVKCLVNRSLFCFVCCLVLATQGFSQQKINVQIIPLDSVAKLKLQNQKLEFKTEDSLNAIKKLKQFSDDWTSKGFLAASFDSLYTDSLNIKAFFYLGSKYSLQNLSFDDVPQFILKKSDLAKTVSKKKSITLKQFLSLREEIIKHYENSGYPFVQVKIDSLSVNNQGVDGELKIETNAFIKIDSIVVKGRPKVSRKYLIYYLAIKKSEAYNQSKIDDLSNSIEELPFLQMAKPTEIEFRDGKADLYLYLKNKPANYFNGIIGFASGTEENPDFQVTGDLSLVLVNAFKIGEQLNIYWDKYSANSQNLKIGFQFPYLFILPIGIDFRFGLEKYELDYLNTDLYGALEYSFSTKNSIKVYFEQKNSYLINNEDELQTRFKKSLRFTAGITFSLDKTDYRFNPREGFFIEASSGYGNRIIDSESSTNLIDFSTSLAYYLKLGRMATLAMINRSAGMFSDFDFYENELLKIGGINNLRGFDEQSIFTSTYSIFSIEPRLLIGKNSAIYLFGDLAWYESKLFDNQSSDTPIGFGLGINIDTKAGIFKLNYALGKQFDNPIKFSDSKVHFGFSARF